MIIGATVAVGVLASLATGCGASDEGTEIVSSGASAPVSTGASAPASMDVAAAPAELPGIDASLVVRALPDGWSYHHEAHPKVPTGEPVVINFYRGAPIALEIPSGGQAYEGMAVNASWMGDLHTSGRDEDLRSLISPDAGYTDVQDIEVSTRPAVLLAAPFVPAASTDYTVVFMIGDWRMQVTGQGVDAETVQAFAANVDVR